ncbi:hydroxymethylglutaryl-CoA reductase [Actinotignum timonense]|uniref:hydroxymethylglutaryl-CoA reductase n=1 Tax=Actinotignum timonense TaxID=1870995 RepID=UPI002549DD41|nr:hydroxymethylglutaryl-CoA reductase [Actinotignum timonense]MDK6373716.1 hydroxymethylglutaryl-CoA reductase [Actinotignum timonense]
MTDSRITPDSHTPIPTKWVGPIHISGPVLSGAVEVPLATYETPLWPSCNRGADVSRMVEGGICVCVADERMSRSVLFIADDAAAALRAVTAIAARRSEWERVVAGQSRFARLLDIHPEVVGNLLFVRFEFSTGDASGHNMATQAAEALMSAIAAVCPELEYGSISGNYCIDKKPSAVNGILGRGRRTIADIFIPDEVIARRLRSDAHRIAELNYRKNWVGSTLAGAVRSANAHYANMLLAVYLATGQDAANIVEGSQGFTHVEEREGGLYVSCTLPNLIVGTVGNGKDLPGIEAVMERMDLADRSRPAGENSRRLAAMIAATVLCGELSLLAAQTNPGELMHAHRKFERGGAPAPVNSASVNSVPAGESGARAAEQHSRAKED